MSQVASDSLLWIKNELDHTLARARQALEAYVEHPDGDDALNQCLELLHQVQGTLRIVEVYGAAMLAEEMESVVRGLKSGELQRSDAAFEVLMRAMLQLPDYLERVIGGRRDMPLALLSLLNDLRSVRGQPLLSESALFAYNLAGRSASVVGRAPSTKAVDIRSLAGRLRPKFQMALLGWYKGDQAGGKHLAVLADAAEKLEQAATTPAVFELWWIVGGIFEGLREGGIQADVGLKQLLGQVDRQIKRLMDQGEAQVTEDPAKELVNNLLYYIGRATTNGERIAAIKESFKLGELLSESGEIDENREKISGPNINLMRTVSVAIQEDITRIKDTLDIFVRMGKSETTELAPLDALLKKVGDTLKVLGLPKLCELLEAERGRLKEILEGRRAADESATMEIASGIVRVENQLDEAMIGLVDQAAGEQTASERAGLRDVQNAVIRESIINLAHIKEAVVEFVNDPSHVDSLQSLPQRIREIQASLRFLQMERVVVLLESMRQYIRQRLLAGSAMPTQNELDRMADAIVSVEFYLEAIQQGRGNPVSMLDNAEACVANLGFPVGREYTDEAVEADTGNEPLSTAGLVSSVAEAENIVIEPAATIAVENIVPLPATRRPAPVSPMPPPISVPPSNMQQEVPVQQEAPAKPSQPSAAGPAVVPMGEVDPEILEIFLEEAQEEMRSLRENFPRWRSNPADREALTTVRRSLHTLKGSGRMVGARLIGEFAWSFENMLNRVIDQTIEPTDDMFALLERGISALPELVEQLEVGSAPHSDIQPLMETAIGFSRGEQPPLPPVVTSEQVPANQAHPAPRKRSKPSSTAAEQVPVTSPKADSRLHAIFTREAQGHLGVLAAFLTQAEDKPDKRVPDEDLVRAMHTLHGSASMAGIAGIAVLMEPVQHYLMDLSARDVPIPEPVLKILAEVLDAARAMVKALEIGQDSALPDGGLLKRINTQLQPGPGARQQEAGEIKQRITPRADQPLRYVQLSELKDYDQDLAAIFFEEATELLDSTDGTLNQWQQKRDDSQLVMQLQRNLHTLKGGARMAGLTPMGDLSHELETVLTDVVDGRVAVSTELLALLNRSVDRLHRMLEQSYANKPIVDASDLVANLRQMHGHSVDEELEPERPEEHLAPQPPDLQPPVLKVSASQVKAADADLQAQADAEEPAEVAEAALGGAAERRTGSRIQHELVRVRADLLENALNYAGEVGIYRSRLEQQVHSINFNLGELEQTVVRLRDQLRKLEIETEAQILYQFQQESDSREHPEFDPLELDRYSLLQQLSRALGESTSDLVSLQSLLLNQAREAETLLLQQSRVTTELQDGLMRTRMVPFARHAQRLRRVVRQTAEEAHKNVEIRLLGAEGEMDRQVLERVLAPLEHMLRNSVVHGIETPEVRKQRKKPPVGTVTIALSREGSEVVMEVMDDGGGLDLHAIRSKAEEMGLTPKNAKLSEREIMALILEPGFSTAVQVTQSAGRGVGMDVVANDIKQLGGTLRIDSITGQGAKFTVRLPFTLAITQALLVTMADQPYAIPLPSIEGIARIPRAELERLMANENPAYLYGGRPYQLQHLSTLLGIGAPVFSEEVATVPLLLVHGADSNIALITEGMQGSREVVVKSVGPQVSSIRGISGATILGDGSILLILDVTVLTRSLTQVADDALEILEREAPKEDTRIFAMVVDDSITVRRVTQRLLERYGMRVITAKDGVDALALLQENMPDVMLLDIEMPRMDGYELAQHMRNDERFKNIPIIMITSRTGEKHRNRAMEIGVNKYMGKPYQETELLEHIQDLVDGFHPQHTRWE